MILRMQIKRSALPSIFSIAGIAVIVTALAIYLTPLRYVSLVSPTMREMDPKQFYELMQEHPDQYELVDVRSPSIYQSAHAVGAISIPIENLYDDHYALARSHKTIGLICTTGRLAAVAYGYLQYWGLNNTVHIQGGMVNWSSEGLPIEGTNVAAFQAGAVSAQEDSHQ